MKCPKCPGKLEKKTYKSKKHDLEIDQCFSCQGIWLDKGELDELDKFDLSEFDLSSHIDQYNIYEILDQSRGICPRCHKEMETKEVSVRLKKKGDRLKMKIDVCQQCGGFWTDGGEINYLTKIAPSDTPQAGVMASVLSYIGSFFRKTK